ncbi:hypothetical protein K2Z84_27455 [Candidatus Binatia bacterium]|nr:hypothetical protein [Candidatus Binatia bacterium]
MTHARSGRITRLLLAAAVVFGIAPSAPAGTYVDGALPPEFGGGFVPPDPAVLKNVQKASQASAKLAAALEKCWAKGAVNHSRGKPSGVDACLYDAKKGVVPKYDAKIASIAGKAPGLPPCHDFVAAGTQIAALVKGFNATTYCDGTAPTPTPSVVPTSTAASTSSPSPSPTPTPSPSPTPSPTPSPSQSPSPSLSPSPTPTPTPTPVPTASPTPSPIVQCATTTLTVSVAYDSVDPVTGVSVFLGYPGSRINIINEALSEQVTNASGVSGTFLVADNDTNSDTFDDQLAIGLITSGQGIPQGAFASVLYDCVSGRSRPIAQDFTCTAEFATLFGTAPGSCTVTAVQYPPYMCNGQVATIVGTDAGETINGTSGADVIVARGGNDTITALGQNDVVCGGAGNDDIDGGAGADTLFGNSGDDTINGAGGTDVCNGGLGNDTFTGCETTIP